MPTMSAQALRQAVVKTAMSDPAFREELKKDPDKAIEARFGKQSLAIRVEVDQTDVVEILIPHKTKELAESFDRVVKQVGTRTPTRNEFMVSLIHKAWNDSAFLAQLRKDPRAAMDAELGQFGTHLPANAKVVLYEEKGNECRIVVPSPAKETSGELTDAELEAVAGGDVSIGAAIGTAIVIGIAVEVAADVAERVLDEVPILE